MTARETTATWRLRSIETSVGTSEAELRQRACRELGVDPGRLRGFRIVRKSLDARRRGGVRRLRFVHQVDLVVDAGFRSAALARARRSGRAVEAPVAVEPRVERPHESLRTPHAARVVIVGSGPAGLFAAWILGRHGVPSTVLDRGSSVLRRSREVVRFHRTRVPDPESNLLFGEGGAGTFSDGKVYTRIDDPLEVPILAELVEAGAPPELLYDARAHIGTDRLHRILPVLRGRLEALGVAFRWNTRVEGLVPAGGNSSRVAALATSGGEIPCDAVIVAVGHSARDTWGILHEHGVLFEARPFQLGVRIEHPQELVDRGRHGTGPDADSLGAASYQLVCRPDSGVPGVHSFCMCPGGRIVASVNEPGLLCTNGMSNSTHSSRWANAALVATVDPRALGEGPFQGVALQRALERRFFEAGGGDYTAPAQRADDFLAGRASRGTLATSYVFGSTPARIDELLPPEVRDALRRAVARFDGTIPGYGGPAGVLVGVESRSACPVRMPRDPDTRRARGFENLLPAGEGAGHAGGITSAAIDGARSALALLEHGLGAGRRV